MLNFWWRTPIKWNTVITPLNFFLHSTFCSVGHQYVCFMGSHNHIANSAERMWIGICETPGVSEGNLQDTDLDADPNLVAICTVVERLYHPNLATDWLTGLIHSFSILSIKNSCWEPTLWKSYHLYSNSLALFSPLVCSG